MATAEETDATAVQAAPSRLPLIIGLGLALVGGGGGFYAVQSGLLPLGGAFGEAAQVSADAPPSTGTLVDFADLVYVPIEPLVISFTESGRSRHLRFRAELEVPKAQASEVARVMPRVVDVLNTYLRALRVSDLDESGALPRLRAQMLRRVQVVVGAERVNDLLVMEFVLN